MIDHLGYPVSDLQSAKAFYVRALEPLGIGVIMEVPAEKPGDASHVGLGAEGRPFFWLTGGRPAAGGAHIAFAAPNRAAVDGFHRAALAAGGRDNGAPGPRPHYGPDYYGAFVLDADGNNIEAVSRRPE